MRILFWGTPLFAVPSLRALEEEGHDVVGVVTQPDRPAGRGRELTASPIKQVAVEAGAEVVLTPERPRGEAFLEEIRALKADVSVVVAYGHILERAVLDVPPLGSINVHASLLPRLRGAAPINWAIVRGHEVTGVTVMRMVEAMDAGPILLQAEEPIGPEETATELGIRLAEVGAQTLVQALALMDLGALEERGQDEAQATYAPKIDRSTARIAWGADAADVANLVRGMDESPGAWSLLDGAPVKLFRPRPLMDREDASRPGTVIRADEEGGLVVTAGRGAVALGEVQPPGKRRMPAADWIRGRGVSEGRRFE